jgi:hypothetical protein
MSMLALSPTAAAALSAPAQQLLARFRAEPMRWIVLSHASQVAAAGLSPEEFVRAVEELEAAELVERAPYGPLLYIR